MAINKNAFVRYKVLDNCFRNSSKKYFIEDLMEECEKVMTENNSSTNGISRRQIFADIAFMESKDGWSIDLIRSRHGKRIYYRYKEADFSINNMPLNEMEIVQLQTVSEVLSQFKGMPQFQWINELIPKLRQGMAEKDVAATIIEFDNNQYLRGVEYLGLLHSAIYYKKVLKVEYKTFESDQSFDVVIHPYFLKQYNSRWFLFGFNPEKQKYDWNMAVDRILSIEEISQKYISNSSIVWQEYFDDLIGVTKPERTKAESITLRFFGKTGHYIQSKPVHGSQKAKWLDKDTLEVKLQLIINYELERFILSYADAVDVIYPKTLSKKIKGRLQAALNQKEGSKS